MSEENKTTVLANINDEKRVIKAKEFLEYKFTKEELQDMSEEMARTCQDQNAIEGEKKMMNAEYTAKIEGKKTAIQSLAQKITNKCEHRHIDCELHMNHPTNGKKTLIRIDTGETVWIKNMSSEELQLKLNLEQKDVNDAMSTHSEADDNNK